MTGTIRATVNPRLLTKANRLFTGTIKGRIIEILQNARRAGAAQVEITNHDGCVRVHDNGGGIDDFTKLLDLGGSGWEEVFEASEDPAGVGLFCLAPREVKIRSRGKMVTITSDGWTGTPMTVIGDPDPVEGTLLSFSDEPWTASEVDPNAVFSGMQVTVDGNACPSEDFISDQAASHPELGCRIEVRDATDLNSWHNSCRRDSYYGNNVLVNFHGQVVSLDCHGVGEHHLHYLVDMTDEPTGIRLMLPARTCLVQNDAYGALLAAMELEAFRHLQRRGHHKLSYKEYLRARELGIILPEATPTFRVGLLSSEPPEPVEVAMPQDFPLAKCYRLAVDHEDGDETDEANVHLLAAMGKFEEPFIPVDIPGEYDGYSWANLPTITIVELAIGKTICESWLWSGKIVCVDRITITAHTSDGKSFSSPVCMAMKPAGDDPDKRVWEDVIFVTAEAQDRLNPSEIWYHLGGWSDGGDTYDTQESEFTENLEQFWLQLVGPDEHLRVRILESMAGLERNWRSATIAANGTVTILFRDGSQKKLRPPRA